METNNIYRPWIPKNSYKTKKHPSTVYESDHMSSVELPEIRSNLNLKGYSSNLKNSISDVQMEAISYAINTMYDIDSIKNNSRGFFLGDGTGVGKSRSIAGILSELWIREPIEYRAVWISLNKNLEYDAHNEYKIVNSLGNDSAPWLTLKDVKSGKNGLLFSSYGSLIRSETSDIVYEWLRNSDNVTIVFDEAHMAKNSKSLTGKMVLEIQNLNINPKIVYSTATAASDVRQLHYMTRLGLWTGEHNLFVKLLESYGSSAMEMTALQLKHSGKLVSRQLGFDGIEVFLKTYELNQKEKNYYDKLTSCWKNSNCLNGIDNQNFFQHLITSFKVCLAINEIQTSLNNGESVVIGLQTTGEACYGRTDSIDNTFYSCIRDLFQRYELLENLSDITFTKNPIDIIIEKFGVNNVAEISGRKVRPITQNDGSIKMEKLPSLKSELENFQKDKKRIAIITKSGSSGISLHSDKYNITSGNKRHHIILEPPRSAELLIQQFGRTNRTNSNHPPKYTIIVTNIPAEFRFFYGITSKLEKLGALTKGDRRASLFNNLNYEGCSNITTKGYRSFILEINIHISNHWYKRQNHLGAENNNVSKLILGLYSNDYILNNEERATIFFTKILCNLNNYILGIYSFESYGNSYEPSMLRWNSDTWSHIWREISRGIPFRLTDISLACILKSLWNVMPDYLPETKHLFRDLTEWFPNNNHLHSKQVKETVKTILLCQMRPECINTLGSLPTHLIHNIIPWLIPRNDVYRLSQNEIIKCFGTGNNRYIQSGGIKHFLNKLLEFPIHIQKIFFPIFRYHNSINNDISSRGINNVSKYVLGSNRHPYRIKYKGFENTGDNYELHVEAEPFDSFDDHKKRFKSWQKRVINYVRFKGHVNKFGIVISALDQSRWYCELWYPGHIIPARCFMKYQWEQEVNNYQVLHLSEDDWINSLIRSYNYQERISKKFNSILVFAVNDAINRWQISTGKLLRVNNTGVCKDFIGLLIKKRRVHEIYEMSDGPLRRTRKRLENPS